MSSSSLVLALRSAQSGLLANQLALDTVANNVANVNTPGYSRKIAETETRMVSGSGAGVSLADITRRVDTTLVSGLRDEQGTLSSMETQDLYLSRVMDLFGEPASNTSLAHAISDLQEAVEALSAAPQNNLEQREFAQQAEEMARKFRVLTEGIQKLRQDADREIADSINEVNDLTGRIAEINFSISSNKATGVASPDLEDQRDRLLDQLSSLMDVRSVKRSTGEMIVFSEGGRTLVDSNAVQLVHNAAPAMAANTSYAEGEIDGITINSGNVESDVTEVIRGGKLAALIELRDKILPNLQSSIDELAQNARTEINRVHNQGTAFPGLTEMTGSRVFTNSAAQTITFASGDSRMILFDGQGNQVRTTTMQTLLGGAGPATIDQVATAVDTWLGADGNAAVVNGQLTINVTAANQGLSFRDETTPSTAGSDFGEATLSFDADGANGIDSTHMGFSNFFGLNDLFSDGRAQSTYESDVLSKSFTATAAATLSLRDSSGAYPAVTIPVGATLSEIAATLDAINGISAALIPDGNAYRLRISSEDNSTLTLTQDVAGGDVLLTQLGMHPASVDAAAGLYLRDDIRNAPHLVSTGMPQWDATANVGGRYALSVGDNSVASAIAALMAANATFSGAGILEGGAATFANRAASLIGAASSDSKNIETRYETQQQLVESLKLKSDSTRGVNVDQEMSDLMLYEQSYAASARVINSVQKMFDVLEQIV